MRQDIEYAAKQIDQPNTYLKKSVIGIRDTLVNGKVDIMLKVEVSNEWRILYC